MCPPHLTTKQSQIQCVSLWNVSQFCSGVPLFPCHLVNSASLFLRSFQTHPPWSLVHIFFFFFLTNTQANKSSKDFSQGVQGGGGVHCCGPGRSPDGEQRPHAAYPAHVCTFLLNPFTTRALNLRLNYKPYEGRVHSLRFFYIAQCFSQCSAYHRCTINNHYPHKKEMHTHVCWVHTWIWKTAAAGTEPRRPGAPYQKGNNCREPKSRKTP